MSIPIRKLQALFGARLQENVRMANYTTSRVGGPALGLIALNTLDEMRETTAALWSLDIPFKLIGSGSNILVSDKGYPGIILLNHCHNIRINTRKTRLASTPKAARTSATWPVKAPCAVFPDWSGLAACRARSAARFMGTPARLALIFPNRWSPFRLCCAAKAKKP